MGHTDVRCNHVGHNYIDGREERQNDRVNANHSSRLTALNYELLIGSMLTGHDHRVRPDLQEAAADDH